LPGQHTFLYLQKLQGQIPGLLLFVHLEEDPNSDLDWRYLKPRGSYAETGISMPAGEIAFYLAYKFNQTTLPQMPIYSRAGTIC
jgi:hypothetical protein